MDVDTEAMRAQIDATPGDRLAIAKEDLRHILKAVDTGATAERTLAGIRMQLDCPAIAA